MANANSQVTLDKLHQVITAAIKAQFPSLVTVEFYSDARTKPAAPACLLELTEMERYEQHDPGTEQLAATCRFEARLVLGFRTVNARLEIRKLAAAFAAWLHQRTWRAAGAPSGPAQVIGAFKDEFSPELDEFEVWRVEWTQEIHLGANVWIDTTGATTPTGIFSHAHAVDDVAAVTTSSDGTHHDLAEYEKVS